MRQVMMAAGRVSIVALLLIAAALPAAAQCEQLRVQDAELWTVDGEARTRVVRDPRGVIAPAWSPQRETIAYGREADFDLDVPAELALIDRRGRTLRTLPLPAESPVNAILEVGWRSANRVWAVGHVNPSTSMYLEWDIESGKLVAEEPGARFTVSRDGRSVAWLENVPHGAPPPHDAATLVIDGKPVWPGDERYHRISGKLAWSPDSRRLAFIDDVEEARELVTIEQGGKLLSHVRLQTEDEPQLLGWLGDAVLIAGSGEEALRVTSTGAVEKTDLPVRDIQLRIEAERCRP